jgi:hypothetical protein
MESKMLTKEELQLLNELVMVKQEEAMSNAHMWTVGGVNYKELVALANRYTRISEKLENEIQEIEDSK